mmetsp:Transcript_26179/g.43813  ORF Transcript_26179/g.43813 Transcript_26179/m.43813 type:complete len:374 (-) Transcript_26179:1403-2524(-)
MPSSIRICTFPECSLVFPEYSLNFPSPSECSLNVLSTPIAPQTAPTNGSTISLIRSMLREVYPTPIVIIELAVVLLKHLLKFRERDHTTLRRIHIAHVMLRRLRREPRVARSESCLERGLIQKPIPGGVKLVKRLLDPLVPQGLLLNRLPVCHRRHQTGRFHRPSPRDVDRLEDAIGLRDLHVVAHLLERMLQVLGRDFLLRCARPSAREILQMEELAQLLPFLLDLVQVGGDRLQRRLLEVGVSPESLQILQRIAIEAHHHICRQPISERKCARGAVPQPLVLQGFACARPILRFHLQERAHQRLCELGQLLPCLVLEVERAERDGSKRVSARKILFPWRVLKRQASAQQLVSHDAHAPHISLGAVLGHRRP